MYKKISHNIVEEHFDHPSVLPLGIGSPALGCLTATMIASVPLNAIMNDGSMQYRMDTRSAWGKWVRSLINYSISLTGGLPGTDQVKGRMHKNAAALGELLVPFYGPSATQSFTTALIAIDDVGMHYVEASKAGASQSELDIISETWKPYIANIAKLLNELNPNYWPASTLSDIFTSLVNGWENELAARLKGDIIASELAIDFLDKLVITGVPDHGAGYRSLADIMSWGIIAQFPERFA